jgi:uncharacterized protein YxjI
MRDRREGRREERVQYRMRQRIVSIGDDYWIENDQGERVFKVDGKALRLRNTLVLEDAHGHELAKIQEKMFRIKDAMEIEDAEGHRIAMVKKALISPLRERWKVEVEAGPDMEIHGNVVDHEYEIEADDRKIAEISKKWFRVRDTYGVEISPDQDPVLILAVTIAIDSMAHPVR